MGNKAKYLANNELSKKDIEHIKGMRKDGIAKKEIMRIYHISNTKLNEILNELPAKKLTQTEKERIAKFRLNNPNVPLRQIASMFGTSTGTVCQLAKKYS